MEEVVATVTRSDGWWAVEVPINGAIHYTQGRTLAEARKMAEDVVRIWADELDSDALRAATVTLDIVGEERDLTDAVAKAQEAAEDLVRAARRAQHKVVTDLRAQGITTQDIADLMGITKGRVSQLANLS